MSEELTSLPDDSSPPSETTAPIGGPKRRFQLGAGAVIALALLGGIATWIVLGRGSSSPEGPRVVPVEPVALSASGLKNLATLVQQPIYWAGPQPNYLYELKRTPEGNVYIRYLPPGVDAGAPGNKYLVVATYPFRGAYAALKDVATGDGIQVPGGGLAVVDKKTSKSVHLAFPKIDYQVEVFDPSPARALAVATSGQVRPAQGP